MRIRLLRSKLERTFNLQMGRLSLSNLTLADWWVDLSN